MSSWQELLQLFDDSGAAEADTNEVLVVLKEAKLSVPASTDGLVQADFDELGAKVKGFPQRALLKRVLRAAQGQHEAKRARITALSELGWCFVAANSASSSGTGGLSTPSGRGFGGFE